jgi:16S rRNA (guanine527-N7)-methyltransferase
MPAEGLSLLKTYSQSFGIYLSVKQTEQLNHYYSLLRAWNKEINLTSITEPMEIVIRHYYDSISCISVTGDLTGRQLIDVGSGAGFPGIPLKILFPDLSLTLIDSVSKKTNFMNAVVDKLNLKAVEILTKRVETIGREADYRSRYDWAVARSVAHMSVLVEYLLPLVSLGGSMIAMKGTSAEEETAVAVNAISLLGGGNPSIKAVDLPSIVRDGTLHSSESICHYLVVIKKKSETPEGYPRRVGIPQKRPLGI